MILLTYPPFKEGGRSWRWSSTFKTKHIYFLYPPWFLAYSAALLERENIDVNLIDAVATDMDDNAFVNYVNKINPELLVAETSTMTISNDLQLMKRIKDEIGCKIALTGSHVTALCNEIFSSSPFIDFILLGEYEMTLLELAKKLHSGKFQNILGLAFMQQNKIKINEGRPLISDLDSLPFPARHFLPMDRYNEASARVPNQQMISSRGCPFQCVFCVMPQVFYNHTVRYRSPSNVVDEMELLIEDYKPKEIYFDDDSFTLNSQHVLGICKEIKNRSLDIQWSCMGHAKINENVLKEMVNVGCVGIKFGVETVSPNVQDTIKKRLNIEEIKNFVNMAKKYKLRTHATYMLGLPGDTKESMERNLRFAISLGTDKFQISIATPYPGTEFYEWAKANKYLVTEDFRQYDGNKGAVISYPNLSKEEIDDAFKKALNLTSKFDWGIAKRLIQQEYEKQGPIRVIPFLARESFAYSKRLLQKQIFSLKSKISS
jgi:radical SAM superfamily enzyme YgiQ (UPF0313 family)